MQNYYNFRNNKGQFATPIPIKAGCLYDFKGATVRARQKDGKNGMREVSFHKTLIGYVRDSQLKPINRRKVKNYLAAA